MVRYFFQWDSTFNHVFIFIFIEIYEQPYNDLTMT